MDEIQAAKWIFMFAFSFKMTIESNGVCQHLLASMKTALDGS